MYDNAYFKVNINEHIIVQVMTINTFLQTQLLLPMASLVLLVQKNLTVSVFSDSNTQIIFNLMTFLLQDDNSLAVVRLRF